MSEYNDGATITRKLEFLYEGSDIVGVIYTNDDGAATYYYDKNPRGDVIAILDNSGNTVVKYSYNAVSIRRHNMYLNKFWGLTESLFFVA